MKSWFTREVGGQSQDGGASKDAAQRPAMQRAMCAFAGTVAAVILGLTPSPALATIQNDQIGFTPNHVFEGVLQGENVDVLNGNLNLRFPIGQKFMLNDWFGYQLQLYYNSKLWHLDESCTQNSCPAHLSSPDTYGAGFTLHFGRIYNNPNELDHIYRYQSPDGAEHPFCHGSSMNRSCQVEGRALDGTAMKVENHGVEWAILPGDGTRIWFGSSGFAGSYDPSNANGSADGGWWATRIETIASPQESVEISYVKNAQGQLIMPMRIDEITDSADRAITFAHASDEVEINLPVFNSQMSTYTLVLEGRTVDSPGVNDPDHNITVLREIILPELDASEGEKHVFEYDDPGRPEFGYILGWQLPTGAQVRYGYTHYNSDPYKVPYHTEIRVRTLQLEPQGPEYPWIYTRFGDNLVRTVDDAVAEYLGNPWTDTNASKVRLLDPFGNLTVYQFGSTAICKADGGCSPYCDSVGCPSNWSDGMLFRVDAYAGSEEIASRLVRREITDYAFDDEYFQYKYHDHLEKNRSPINVRQKESVVTTFGAAEPTSTRRTIETDWANLTVTGTIDWNMPPLAREVREYDGYTLYRSTYTDYQPNDNFHRNHTYVELRDELGQVLSRTDKKFTGNRLTCEVRRLNGQSPVSWTCAEPELEPGDIVTTFAYDAQEGSVMASTIESDTGPEYSTSYTYLNGALATKSYEPWFEWLAVDRTIDPLTGLVQSSRDPAGVATSYTWDALGRLKTIDAAEEELPILIDYVNIHETRVTQAISPENKTESVYFYDNLGRLVEEQRRSIEGEHDVRLSEYDIAGRLIAQSEWTRDPDDFDLPWTTYEYRIFEEEPEQEGTCRWKSLFGWDDPGGGSLTPCMSDEDCPQGRCHFAPSIECRAHSDCPGPVPECGDGWYVPGTCTGSEAPPGTHCHLDFDTGENEGDYCSSNWPPSYCDTSQGDWSPADPETCHFPPADSGFTDPLGRISRVNRADGGVTETSYDGLVTWVTTWADSSTPRVTRYTNDAFGRLVHVLPPEGAEASYEYDERDNLLEVLLTDPLPPQGASATQLRRFTYDSFSRLQTATNPENGTVQYLAYDPRGHLLEYRDAKSQHFVHAYDQAGRFLSKGVMIDGTVFPLLQNTYDDYDGWGSLLGGEIVWGDASGKLTMQKSYKLDPANHPQEGWELTSWRRLFYGSSTSTACRVTGVEPGYEAYLGLNGRLAWEVNYLPPWWDGEMQTEYCYDPAGQLKVLRYPDDPATETARTDLVYVYQNGYVFSVYDQGRGWEYLSNVEYDSHGAPKKALRSNGSSLVIGRDPFGRPSDFKYMRPDYTTAYGTGTDAFGCGQNKGGAQHAQYNCNPPPAPADEVSEWYTGNYTYDLVGNVTRIGGYVYQYDNIDRLTWAYVNTSTLSYDYDAFGNMLWNGRQSGATMESRSLTVDRESNRLVSMTHTFAGQTNYAYQYDPNGNMGSDGHRGYVFDQQNRLSEVWNTTLGDRLARHDYDGSGYRVHSVAGGAESFYFRDGAGRLLAEYRRPEDTEERPAWNREYIYALGQAITMLQNEAPEAPQRPWIHQRNAIAKTLQIRWDPITEPDFSQYGVERIVDGQAQPILWLSATTQFSDSYASVVQSIAYRVVARDTAGNQSEKSATLVLEPYDPVRPPTPTNFAAIAGDGRVTLTWNAVAVDDLKGYLILREGPPIPVPGTTYVDFDVVNGATYYYQVAAIDTTDRVSSYTIPVAATPQDSGPPGVPTGVRAQPGLDEGQVRIFWDAVLDGDLSGYTVHNLQTDSYVQVGTAATTYMESSLDPGAEYQYRVAARDTNGNTSDESAIASARTRTASTATPGNPQAEEVIDDGGSAEPTSDYCAGDYSDNDIHGVELTWNVAGAGPVFRIYRALQGTDDFDPIYETSTGDDVCVAANCTFFDAYAVGDLQYYVVAVSGLNESEATTAATISAGEFYASEEVRNVWVVDSWEEYSEDDLDLRNNRSRQVDVHWSTVPSGGLRGYHVYRKCDWKSCEIDGESVLLDAEWSDNLRKLECSHSWQRITPEPVSGLNRFTDLTTGAMGGCFDYMVRAVGLDGTESDLSEVITTNLWDLWQPIHQPWEPEPPQCQDAQEAWHPGAASAETTAAEVERINLIHKGQLSGDDLPAAPQVVDSPGDNFGVLPTEHSVEPVDTRYAWIEWQPNQEDDLAGYHIEMAGSIYGPWKRITLAPIAWWETRYDALGLWHEAGSNWAGRQCLALRVIAIDEDGNESLPSAAQQVPENCSPAEDTVAIPQNLATSQGGGSMQGTSNFCSTLIEWDKVPGATKYYVYRSVVTLPWSTFFYRTHTLLDEDCDLYTGRCAFDELGDYTTCPLKNWNWWDAAYPLGTGCETVMFDAFYVTAVDDSGGGTERESPPSEIVFFDCDDPVHAWLAPQSDPTEALAQLNPAPEWPSADLVCSLEVGGPSAGQVEMAASAKPIREPLSAPMWTLGQSPPDPAYSIYDMHWDHLGSTRVVSKSDSEVYALHDYYPFGEEIFGFHDYNTKLFTGHERDEETGLDYMLARYYGAAIARFVAVDPSRASVEVRDPQTYNRYSYVLNNPLNRADPDGQVSYLVARNGPGYSSHMFIVTHAAYPGDPNARIYSWGESSKKGREGKLGRVNKKTTGRSEGTHRADREAWNSLGTKDAKGVDHTEIKAKDGKVASVAEALVENKEYRMFGPNSNSAAQATADTSQGSAVQTPEDEDPAVGAEDSEEVEFDEQAIAADEAAGKHNDHVPEKKP